MTENKLTPPGDFMGYMQIAAILVVAAGIAVMIVIAKIKSNKKLSLRLMSSFGESPFDYDYELDSIKMYSHYKETQEQDDPRIDDITWNDLEMDKVYKRINVCLTSVGEEYLYNCLRELQHNPSRLADREKAINFFTEHPAERLLVQKRLSKVGKINFNGLPSLIFSANIKLLKYPIIYTILYVLPLFGALAAFINVSAAIVCIFMSFVINTIVYYRTKMKVDIEVPAISYFASVLRCGGMLRKIKGIDYLPAMAEIRKYYGIFKSLERKLPTGGFHYQFDITGLFEYANIIALSDIRKYNKVLKRITRYKGEFHAFYRAIGEMDLAICVSSFRKSLPVSSAPEFHAKNTIEFEELYHPLIQAPVTNTGEVRNDSLITGSNASGKSTFIKALAVNGILARTIFTCAAKRFRARPSLIITSMAMRDNVSGGDSYFIVEVKSLKRILDLLDKYPCTCYIDEILRGTNTIERIGASAAVLEYLHTRDCLCVVATHDIELTNILAGQFDNYHFSEQVNDNGVSFDYKLKPGAAKTRNAIKLLKFMGFNAEIVDRAEKLTFQYDENKAW